MFWAAGIVVVVSVLSDILFRKIPNTITLGGLIVGLILHTVVGIFDGGALGALRGFGIALGGAFACGFIPFIAWKKGEMGGGDVKLFAALGAIMGPLMGFDVQAITFGISFLILFPYRLVRYGVLKAAIANIGIGLANIFRRGAEKQAYLTGPKMRPVILAPSIALAFIVTLVRHGAFG